MRWVARAALPAALGSSTRASRLRSQPTTSSSPPRLFATVVWPWWLDGNIVRAFVWWAGAIAFFALVTYLFVNLANILYFNRIVPNKRNSLPTSSSRSSASWSTAGCCTRHSSRALLGLPDWRDGIAIVAFCLIVAALGIVYVLWVRSRKPELLQQQALVFDEGKAEV